MPPKKKATGSQHQKTSAKNAVAASTNKKGGGKTVASAESSSAAVDGSLIAAAPPRGSNSHLDVDMRNLLGCDTVSVSDSIKSVLRRRECIDTTSSSSNNNTSSALNADYSSDSNNNNKLRIILSEKEALGVVESFDLIYNHINNAFTACTNSESNDNDDDDEDSDESDDDKRNSKSNKKKKTTTANNKTKMSLSPISASAFDQTIDCVQSCLELLVQAISVGVPSNNPNLDHQARDNLNPIVVSFEQLLLKNKKAWLGKLQKIFVGLFISSLHRKFFSDQTRDKFIQILEQIFSYAGRAEKIVLGEVFIEKIFVVLHELMTLLEEETLQVLNQIDSAKDTKGQLSALVIESAKQAPFKDMSLYRTLTAAMTQSLISCPENKNRAMLGKDILARLFKHSCDALLQQQIVEIFFRVTRNDAAAGKNLLLQLPLPEKIAEQMAELPRDGTLFAAILSDVVNPFNQHVRRDSGRVRYLNIESFKTGDGQQLVIAPPQQQQQDTSSKSGNSKKLSQKQKQQQAANNNSQQFRPFVVFSPRGFALFQNADGSDTFDVEFNHIRSIRYLEDQPRTLCVRFSFCPPCLEGRIRCGDNVPQGSNEVRIQFTEQDYEKFMSATSVFKKWIIGVLKPAPTATPSAAQQTKSSGKKTNNTKESSFSPQSGRRRGRTAKNNNEDAAEEKDDDDNINKSQQEEEFASPDLSMVNKSNNNNQNEKKRGFGQKSVSFTSQIPQHQDSSAADAFNTSSKSLLRAPNNSLAPIAFVEQQNLPQLPPQTLLRPQDQQFLTNNNSGSSNNNTSAANNTTATNNTNTTSSSNNTNSSGASASSLSQSLQQKQHQQLGLSPTPFNPRNFMNPPNSSIKRQREQHFKDQAEQQQENQQQNHQNLADPSVCLVGEDAASAEKKDNNNNNNNQSINISREDSAPPTPVLATTAGSKNTNKNNNNAFKQNTTTTTSVSPKPLLKFDKTVFEGSNNSNNTDAAANNNNNTNISSSSFLNISGFTSITNQSGKEDGGGDESSNQNNNNKSNVSSRAQSASRKLPQSMSPTPMVGGGARQNNNNQQQQQQRNNHEEDTTTNNNDNNTEDKLQHFVERILNRFDEYLDSLRIEYSKMLDTTKSSLEEKLSKQQDLVSSESRRIRQEHRNEAQQLADQFSSDREEHHNFKNDFEVAVNSFGKKFEETSGIIDMIRKTSAGAASDLKKEMKRRNQDLDSNLSQQMSALEEMIHVRVNSRDVQKDAQSVFDQIVFKTAGGGNNNNSVSRGSSNMMQHNNNNQFVAGF